MHVLTALSRTVAPEDVADPVARRALLHCARTLRTKLPPGRWPQPYQMVGIAYAHLARDRALIADEQGLGKTVQALCRIAVMGYRTTVIVTTSTTVDSVWAAHVRDWLPGTPLCVLGDGHAEVPPPGWHGVVCVTWDLMKSRYLAGLCRLRPDLVIADEAHAAKNEESQRYGAIEELAQVAPHVLLLTGTPVLNRSTELWQLLYLVDPRAWPEVTRGAFEAVDSESIDDARKADDRLQQRIRQYMLRRLKADVPTQIPDKRYATIEVVLPPAVRRDYDRLNTAFRRWLEGHLTAQALRAAREMGRDLCEADFDAVTERVEAATRREVFVKIGFLRRLLGPAKVPAALEWIAKCHGARRPAVVFFEHRQVHEMLAAGLERMRVPYVTVVGDTPRRQRAEAVREFQAGRVPVLLASHAAQEGVTLTAAADVLLIEPWWNPGGEAQAEDRLHRIGQRRQVTVTKLVAVDTYDERIAEIHRKKRQITLRVVGAARGAPPAPPPPPA